MKFSWPFIILVSLTLVVVIAASERVWRLTQHESPITPSATNAPVLQPTASNLRVTAALATNDTPAPVPATQTPLPTQTLIPTVTSTPLPQAQGYLAYRVKEGDTLDQIAQASGSIPQLIREYNRLNSDIYPQRPLIIPQTNPAASTLESQPVIVQRGANRPAVALTLDAGADSAPTGAMLDVLAERNIQITFFLTGDWIERNPELTKRIVADGHEVGNHSTSHPDFRGLDESGMLLELQTMSDRLYAVTGTRPAPYFRPPYGAYDERVLRVVIANGYLPIFWTLDSLDSVGDPKSADFLVDRLTNTLAPDKRNGAILLAHCGNATTAEAFPRILDAFAAQGLVVTTLSQTL
ncbi:MAG: LysM peptidoglycan-binding domain-containing protein [Chloroflexi bacterium]|nr:LysM peptidoglycan-binding domain-containing protein [Chloroflexota bacterium]